MRAALLFGLCLSLVACLPGKRDNAVTTTDGAPLDGSDLDGNSGVDGVAIDGIGGDASDPAQRDGGGDSDLADSDLADSDLADSDLADSGPAPLPKGCSEDKDCAVLAINPCATPACDLISGLCELTDVADGTPCKLADPCIIQTSCDGGVCTGKDETCDDKNPCTADGCVAFVGCRHLAVQSICNDGDPCTLADACTESACKGIAQDCTTLDACKVGSCDPTNGDCDYGGNAKSGVACDDNNPCTQGDGCDGNGACAGVKINGVKLCDDKNPCTRDVCNPAIKGGCDHLPEAGPGTCTDGKPCTDDACKAGTCVSTTVMCDDVKPCTEDACETATNGVDPVCTHTKLNKGSCVDAKPCAAEATCLDGTCTVGKVKTCDDGNVCTKDACEAKAGGCLYLDQPGPCNDGSGCTKDDVCKLGKCTGAKKNCSDGDPCTIDTCDPITAKCNNALAPNGYACAPGSVCKFGLCKAEG